MTAQVLHQGLSSLIKDGSPDDNFIIWTLARFPEPFIQAVYDVRNNQITINLPWSIESNARHSFSSEKVESLKNLGWYDDPSDSMSFAYDFYYRHAISSERDIYEVAALIEKTFVNVFDKSSDEDLHVEIHLGDPTAVAETELYGANNAYKDMEARHGDHVFQQSIVIDKPPDEPLNTASQLGKTQSPAATEKRNMSDDIAGTEVRHGLSGLQKTTIVISLLSALGAAVANWTNVFTSVSPMATAGGNAGQVASTSNTPQVPLTTTTPQVTELSIESDKSEPEKNVFEGQLVNGKPHGPGTLIKSDGTRIVGEFLNGVPHGLASETKTDGAKYKGPWMDGVYHGAEGLLELSDGTIYRGDFVNGQPEGSGKLSWKDQTVQYVYEGQFIAGKFQGKGRLQRDGFLYEGDFVSGDFHGKGRLALNDRVYDGDFRDGKMNGVGSLTYTDGKIYVGTFIDNSVTGAGVITTPNGIRYQGSVKDEKFDGCGRLNYPNGEIYVGMFTGGARSGIGILYNKRGSVLKRGEWSGDSLLKRQSLSTDRFPYSAGTPSC
jgi:hypothetical protein